MGKNLEAVIKRVGMKYLEASKPLRITVGEILEGKINAKVQGGKSNEQSAKFKNYKT